MLGGLCLFILYIGLFWFNMFGAHFAARSSGLTASLAAVFSWPVCMIVGTIGTLLGCAPHGLHRPAWLGSAGVICYLVAAVLVPLGYYATLNQWSAYADAAFWAIMLGVLAPVSVVTGNWIASALRRRLGRPSSA